ncbi:Dbl homology domain-containing protein, partial [Exidia glandulosa HHB12029]
MLAADDDAQLAVSAARNPQLVVHAPSDKSLQKKFTLHANSSTDSASESSSSLSRSQQATSSKRGADDERRRHALLELVDTEHGYVQDLRVLVDVYLARLPVMLPNLDAPLVARNAHELLAFHDEFATELADAADSGTVSDAIARVARLFLQHAPRFAPIYDAFCLGHLAASDALRKHEARADYAAFERTCAAIAVPPTAPHLVHANTQPEPPTRTTSSSRLSILARPRRHSLGAASSAIAAAEFARGHAHSASGSSSISQPATSTAGSANTIAAPTAPALHFADLLIKPVQRICRYPLLLVQLVSSASKDESLQAALQAMRDAAAAADDASQRADAAFRSQLIRTRIGMSASSAPIFAPKEEVLPAAFLDSLGVVRFAGSLDVVQHSCPPVQGNGHEPKRRHL